MMIAHRSSNLGLQVLRGREDLVRAGVENTARATGLDRSTFVTAFSAPEPTTHSWERLPEALLLTAERGQMPRSESL
jgi:hypothetical protein